jgi:hypothetical protein
MARMHLKELLGTRLDSNNWSNFSVNVCVLPEPADAETTVKFGKLSPVSFGRMEATIGQSFFLQKCSQIVRRLQWIGYESDALPSNFYPAFGLLVVP